MKMLNLNAPKHKLNFTEKKLILQSGYTYNLQPSTGW